MRGAFTFESKRHDQGLLLGLDLYSVPNLIGLPDRQSYVLRDIIPQTTVHLFPGKPRQR